MPDATERAPVDDRPVYTPPRATRLAARARAAGDCTSGSHDTGNCASGSNAGVGCGGDGSSPAAGCFNGGTAGFDCAAGGGD